MTQIEGRNVGGRGAVEHDWLMEDEGQGHEKNDQDEEQELDQPFKPHRTEVDESARTHYFVPGRSWEIWKM